MLKSSLFQQAIETVEKLSLEEQQILIETLQKRLSQERRTLLNEEMKEVHQEVKEGQVKFGSVDDFLEELDRQ